MFVIPVGGVDRTNHRRTPNQSNCDFNLIYGCVGIAGILKWCSRLAFTEGTKVLAVIRWDSAVRTSKATIVFILRKINQTPGHEAAVGYARNCNGKRRSYKRHQHAY